MSFFTVFAQYPTNGLKGHWQFDGNALDISGYNNNGTLLGGATYGEDRFGVPNKAAQFGGFFNSSAIVVPNSASLALTNQLTIACWFKLDSVAGMNIGDWLMYDTNNTPVHALIAKDGDRSGFSVRYILNPSSNPTLSRFRTSFLIMENSTCSNSADFAVQNIRNCIKTEWVHVAIVVDTFSVTMYLNGMQYDRQTYNTAITFTQANQRDLTFGRFGYNCNKTPHTWYPLNGRLDDFFYYNRALSQAEIWDLMNYPQVYATPGLITTTLKDYSEQGQPYTRNGFNLPVQNELGLHTYNRTNGCDSIWILTLDVYKKDSICAGDSISLGASVTECDTNDYQWFVNGLPRVGEKDSIFSYAPANGDTVRCRVVPKCNDCFVLDTLYSGAFVFIQKPRPTLSVRDSSNKNDVCTETAVTFYALSTNGGTPAYQWIINGVDTLGETGSTFIYAPENNDFVQVRVTSSLDCATPNPVTSTGITMKINPKETPTIRIKRKRE